MLSSSFSDLIDKFYDEFYVVKEGVVVLERRRYKEK